MIASHLREASLIGDALERPVRKIGKIASASQHKPALRIMLTGK